MATWVRRAARAAIVAVAAVAGCQLAAPFAAGPQPPPNLSWAPQPIDPDRAFAEAAYETCVGDRGAGAGVGKLPLLVQDQRGADGAFLVWGDASEERSCLAFRRPDGSAGLVSGVVGGGIGAADRLFVTMSFGGPPSGLIGNTGRGTRIVIQLQNGLSFEASTGGGRFAAWWPQASQAGWVRAFDDAGNLVETYKIEGVAAPPPAAP